VDVAATPVRNRRGDIHSSVGIAPSSAARRLRRADRGDAPNDNLNSDGAHLSIPLSSAPRFSAPAEPTDEPDEIRAIWGTTVNLAETMKLFREFLKGFKPKYRVAYDRELGVRTHVLASPEEGEVTLYETYLRQMRQIGETNLNLDMVDLLAYPPSKKLHNQLVKYPQEVVPAMDQVLKDLMLETADMDQRAGMQGMQGAQGEEEIAEIMGKIYKVRPFGMNSVNMRDLNPGGKAFALHEFAYYY
jgi:DNA replication licensing factor MCM4